MNLLNLIQMLATLVQFSYIFGIIGELLRILMCLARVTDDLRFGTAGHIISALLAPRLVRLLSYRIMPQCY